jgi:hypothetical protein
VIWLVVVEAVAICVLGLVVVALAHSYAGLAARVEQAAPTAGASRPVKLTEPALGLVEPRGASPVVADLDGVTPDGERVLLPLLGAADDTLLAFLSSGCASCRALWHELRTARSSGTLGPVRLVVVTKGPDRESPAAMADLAVRAGGADVVMSSEAWAALEVPGSPYFALVSRSSGEILGQGTARTWDQVAGLMDVAAGDARHGSSARKSRRDRRQEMDVDRVLLDAGVLPGDPSLYPVPTEGAPTT